MKPQRSLSGRLWGNGTHIKSTPELFPTRRLFRRRRSACYNPKGALGPPFFFFSLLASIKSRRLNHDGMTSNDAIHISRTTAVHLRVRGSCFFWSSGPLIIRSLALWHGRRGSGQRAVEPAELSRGNQCFLPGAIIYSRP